MDGLWASSGVYLFSRWIIKVHGCLSMSTDPESRTGFGPYLEGVGPTYVDEHGDEQLIRYGVIEDLEKAFDLYGDQLAAFLVEPIQGEAGIVVPPEGYLKKVAALCKKYNVLLICDEIQTVGLAYLTPVGNDAHHRKIGALQDGQNVGVGLGGHPS